MYPFVNGLTDNLTRMMKARDARVAQQSDIHGPQPRLIGGPLPDPAWDALFQSLDDTAGRAAAGGYGFHVDAPSLAGLRSAGRR